MTAYRRVYDSRHLQADCQEPGSASEPIRSAIEYGLPIYILECQKLVVACVYNARDFINLTITATNCANKIRAQPACKDHATAIDFFMLDGCHAVQFSDVGCLSDLTDRRP